MTAREKVGVRLSPSDVAAVDRLAAADHRNRSDMIRVLLVEAIAARNVPRVMMSTMCSCGDMQPIAAAETGNLFTGNGVCLEGGTELPPAAPASDPVPDENGDRADVALADLDDALAHPCDCDAHNEIRRQMQDPAFVEAWAQLRERQSVVRTLDVAEETVALARPGGAQ